MCVCVRDRMRWARNRWMRGASATEVVVIAKPGGKGGKEGGTCVYVCGVCVGRGHLPSHSPSDFDPGAVHVHPIAGRPVGLVHALSHPHANTLHHPYPLPLPTGKAVWVVSTFGYSVAFDPAYGLPGVTFSAARTATVDTIMIAGTAPIPAAAPTDIQGKNVQGNNAQGDNAQGNSVEISWTPGAPNDCKFSKWVVTVQGTKVKSGAMSLWETPKVTTNLTPYHLTLNLTLTLMLKPNRCHPKTNTKP